MKILLIGDSGVGKTSFCRKMFGLGFHSKYNPTYGTFHYQIIKNNIILDLYDVGGQDILNINIISNPDLVLLCFDLTSMLSFKNTKLWKDMIHIIGNIPIILCGLKCDINSVKVSEAIITSIYGNIPYIKISSKNDINIDSLSSMILSYNK